MISDVDVTRHRNPDHDILDVIWQRWSPRVMDGTAVSQRELMRLFEAARWAPSAYNRQPWRFVYAIRDDEYWAEFFDLLVEGNQRWCKEAGALIVIAAKTTDDEGETTRTHAFDVGAAWENLAVQGCSMGLVIHGMEGFDYDRAQQVIGLDDEYAVQAMIAVGHPGTLDDAPEKLREREQPSGRRAVSDFAFNGRFRPT